MPQVFLSYAHADAAFVDRLYRDLSVAGVSATYDKVALEIGDSIVEKVSGIIQGAACVVGVVSSASVQSRWVQRELSWALSGELGGRTLKVLPAVIDQCDLPAMLSDKLYADFRRQYFPALRALVKGIRRALVPGDAGEREPASAPEPYDAYLGDCAQLEGDMAHADWEGVFRWLRSRPRIVAALVANPSDVVLVDPCVEGAPSRDTFVCWTAATQYLWHLVRLGPLALTETDADAVWQQAVELAAQARERRQRLAAYVRRCAWADASGALMPLLEELEPRARPPATAGGAAAPDRSSSPVPRAVQDRLILLAGRRRDHQGALLRLRRDARADLGVEIKSCEWLLEALGSRLYRRNLAVGR